MIETRLTRLLGLDYPIIQAPMAFAAGGALAASVTRAGGLGLIGGAYADDDWVNGEFTNAGNTEVGCGFITWALAKNPQLLTRTLERNPKAVFLSFADPAPFAREIEAAGVPLICQVQSLRDAERAIDVGAAIVVAQGAEAGGHGESRATMSFAPEVADLIARKQSKVLLCAAGGIADGRGLAAALMLGADGVVIGSRFWASEEAIVHPNMWEAAKAATGDDTVQSSVMDIARKLNWPDRYRARVLKNAFTERWHGDLDGLIANAVAQAELWREAWNAGDVETANTFVGEVAGLIDDIVPAATLVKRIVKQAEQRLTLFP